MKAIKTCRSCDAPIVWLATSTGKAMPVNADTVGHDENFFDSTKHVSHFATCPNANQHRKPRK